MIDFLNNFMWSLFLPFLIIVSLYCLFKYNFNIKKTIKNDKFNLIKAISQISISLGAMIGTGAIIGVLGSLTSIYISGQVYIEAMVFWAIIGAVFLVPFAYFETIVAKTTNMNPKEYISKLISPKAGIVYGISFCILHIFGFGGFQFQGINSAITIAGNEFLNWDLTQIQRFVLIIIPIIILISIIILANKQEYFINIMSLFIGIAVIFYLIFAFMFVFKTSDYIPIFFNNMIEGIKNPITSIVGIPIGMTVAFQRIAQVSEPGLGAFAISSLSSDLKPKSAGIVSIFSSTLTIFIAIFITTYIVSYGNTVGFIDLTNIDSLNLLTGYFTTGFNIMGYFGLFVLVIFTILSGLTTLLGAHYFLQILFKLKLKTEFILYITLITLSGTLAIYGTSFIFSIVDLLLFIVAFINISAIIIYFRNNK